MMRAEGLVEDFAPDWAAIGVVIMGVTAFSVSQGLTYPLIALILESRGVSTSLSGLNAAVFALGLITSTLMVGRLTAFIRGDRLIVAGLVGAALSLATLAAFDQVWVWFVARFLLGFSASIIFTLSEAWLNSAPTGCAAGCRASTVPACAAALRRGRSPFPSSVPATVSPLRWLPSMSLSSRLPR